MINLQGQKALPGPKGVVNIAAGVMYSGGSHMCYANKPLALSQCSNCSVMGGGAGARLLSGSEEGDDSQWPGQQQGLCSADIVANKSQQVARDYCCPQNVTELHYLHHPEDCKCWI